MNKKMKHYKNGISAMLIMGLMAAAFPGCSPPPSQQRIYKIAQPSPAPPVMSNRQAERRTYKLRSQNRRQIPPGHMQFTSTQTPPRQPASGPQPTPPPKPAAASRKKPVRPPDVNFTASQKYHIGSGDVLNVRINQLLEPDKVESLEVEVDHNGQIYLPLLNYLDVKGMTVDQVREKITARLAKEYIREPEVDVKIEEYHSKQVMVLGHVKRPGAVTLQSDSSTLLDMIAEAGGVLNDPAPEIEILRGAYDPAGRMGVQMFSVGEHNNVTRELVPVSKLFAEEGSSRVNPPIYAGDVIKVRASTDGYFYIDGEVARPGSKIFRQPMTILQAVTSAGGVTRVAKDKTCKIIRRKTDGSEKEIIVNLADIRKGKKDNFYIARNDTIIIPQDPGKKFLDDLNKMFIRGMSVGVSMTYDAAQDMGIPSGHARGTSGL